MAVVYQTDFTTPTAETPINEYPSAGSPDFTYVVGASDDIVINPTTDRTQRGSVASGSDEPYARLTAAGIPTETYEVRGPLFFNASFHSGQWGARFAANGDGYALYVNPGGQDLQLYRRVGGTPTLIDQISSIGLTQGAVCFIRVEPNGNDTDITYGEVDGTQTTFTDADANDLELGLPAIGHFDDRNNGGTDAGCGDMVVDDLQAGGTPVTATYSPQHEALQAVSAERTESQEALQAIASQRTDHQESLESIDVQQINVLESLLGSRGERSAVHEAFEAIRSARSAEHEAIGTGVAALSTAEQEALSSPSSGRAGQQESLTTASASRVIHVESLSAAAATRAVIQEALTDATQTLTAAFEALQGAVAIASPVYEGLVGGSELASPFHEVLSAVTPVAQTGEIPMEAIGTVSAGRSPAHETLAAILVSRTGHHEAVQVVVVSGAAVHEALQSVSSARTAVIEALTAAVRQRSPFHEVLSQIVLRAVDVSHEAIETASSARAVAHEALAQAAAAHGADMEALQEIQQTRPVVYESLVSAIAAAQVIHEVLGLPGFTPDVIDFRRATVKLIDFRRATVKLIDERLAAMPNLRERVRKVLAGDTLTIRREISRQDDDGNLQMAAGAVVVSAKLTVRSLEDDPDPPLMLKSITTTDNPGVGQVEGDGALDTKPIVRFDLAAADTRAIYDGKPAQRNLWPAYDIELTLSDGSIVTPIKGQMRFEADVSR